MIKHSTERYVLLYKLIIYFDTTGIATNISVGMTYSGDNKSNH